MRFECWQKCCCGRKRQAWTQWNRKWRERWRTNYGEKEVRERGEGSASSSWVSEGNSWECYVTGGECLEVAVFITLFTCPCVYVCVCVCVSLISVLSFNIFAHLTVNRYLLHSIVTSDCHHCHLALFILSLIPCVYVFLSHDPLWLTGRSSCAPVHRDCPEGADQTMPFLWGFREPPVLSRDHVKCPGTVGKKPSGVDILSRNATPRYKYPYIFVR